MPWKIAHSSGAIIELLPRVIRRSTVQKKCQKGVNTRENASRRRAAYVYHEARAHQQSMVLSRSFLCCSFSLLEVSQTCSQLIHTRFVAVLASGLETRNQLQKRQEKNEFNFQLGQKNFLTEKLSARVCSKTEIVRRKFRETQTSKRSESPRPNRLGRLIVCASELTKLAYARNFPPLRPEGQRSPSCRWRQPIPIPSGVFRCA